MVKRVSRFITFLLFFFSHVQISSAQVFDKIVAVVNDDVITLSDLRSAGKDILNDLRSLSEEERIQREIEATSQILDRLIEDMLVVQEAQSYGIKATDQEVHDAMAEVKKNNRMTDKEFSKALSSMGMSLTAYKDGMKRDIIRSKFMGRILGSRVTVTKDEVEFYYNRRGSAFLLPSEIRLGQILLLTRGDMIEDEKAAVKSQAQRILERIRGGEDFAELASQYSQVPGEGGDLGYVKKGEINSDIEKVVFSLKNGEVSDLTETSLGYHIFKILDIKDENKKPLSEVREEIENILFNEKLEVVYKEWLESMKAKSYIDVRL